MDKPTKPKRIRAGHMSTMAAFKCESCGFCFSQSIKWATKWLGAHGVPICLNKECAVKGSPLKRLGKLTTDQLNNGELIYFNKLTTKQGKTKIEALQDIESIRSDTCATIEETGVLVAWDEQPVGEAGGEHE